MQLIQKLRDDQKCMKKLEPSSRSMATEDIISIGSFVEVLVLNDYVLVRKILGKLSKLQDEDAQNKMNIQEPRKLWCSGLVPNPAPAIPCVPPTNKELEILFQPMFDEYFKPSSVDRHVPPAPAAQVPVNSTGPSVSISVDQDAPSGSHSPSSLDHQSSFVHHGVAAGHSFEVNPLAPANNEPFVNIFAPDLSSEASSSGEITIAESNQSIQPHDHLRKWTDSHPIDNIIRNPS
ncbi:hypothetical protein Tco_0070998 [Tanacetum coccineum]